MEKTALGGPHLLPELGTIGPPPPALSQTWKPAPVSSAAALRGVFFQGPAGTEEKRLHVGLKRIECGRLGEGILPSFVVRGDDHQNAGIVVSSNGDAFVRLAKRPVHCCKGLSASASRNYIQNLLPARASVGPQAEDAAVTLARGCFQRSPIDDADDPA